MRQLRLVFLFVLILGGSVYGAEMIQIDDLIGVLVAARSEHGNVKCFVSLIGSPSEEGSTKLDKVLVHSAGMPFVDFHKDIDGDLINIVFHDIDDQDGKKP
jgi:hypothetical protein